MPEPLPEGLDRDRHSELTGRAGEPWVRRGVIALLALVIVVALLGAFGQRHEIVQAQATSASLRVKVPKVVRGGLFFQGRLDVVAHEEIRRPRFLLGEGWTEEMQLNTLEPAPAAVTSTGGRLDIEYDTLRRDDHLTIWLQYTVNPTNVGKRDRSVTLLDGDRELARAPGTIRVLP
jgi:hypothetical protein